MYLETEKNKKFNFSQSDQKMGQLLMIFLIILNLIYFFKIREISFYLIIIFLIISSFTFILPRVFKPLNYLFSKLVLFIANFVSLSVMIILYFLVLFPLSIFTKIVRKKEGGSNWIKTTENSNNFDKEY
jgi:hypothetical protein